MSDTTDKAAAIAQLRALAGPSLDADGARAVLEAVSYNVQAAAEMILDDPASSAASALSSRNVHTPSSSSSQSTSHTPLASSSSTSSQRNTMGIANPSIPSTSRIEPLEIDDSLVGPPSRSGAGNLGLVGALGTIIRLPLGLLAALIRLVLQLLRLPVPALLRPGPLGAPNFYRRPQPGARHDAVADAERWLRELEEEAGALQSSPTGTASGVQGPGSSGLSHRTGTSDISRHIPDFTTTSYDSFVQSLQSTFSIGVIILLSSEHSTHSEFVHTTLTDSTFLSTISNHHLKAWGGDVRYRDAWSASQKLGATTYPFVAFIALQPRRSSSGSGAPRLTVLSRLQGIQNTSASALSAHISDTLVPRVQPYLERLSTERRAQQQEREYRAQQEQAYADAAAKDAARIEARLALEREAAASAASLAQASRDAEKAAEVLAQKNQKRSEWRRYIRASGIVPQEAKVGSGRGATRVVLRMPDGRRVVRVFPVGAEVGALYAFAAASLVPSRDVSPSSSSLALDRGADIPTSPNGVEGEEGILKAIQSEAGGNAEEWWGFRLASAFPRRVLAWEKGKRIDAVEGFRGGAQLVVEMLDEGARSPKSPRSAGEDGSGSDGYETESD